MAQIISIETLRAARRSQTVETPVLYVGADGKLKTVTKRIVNGEMEVFELDRPTGEMLTTPAGLDALVQKTVIDLELGREAVPLLYGPIYRRMEDANFTEHVEVQGILASARVVFLEHLELEEVRFGARVLGTKQTVPIITYAAGFQWTEDMVLYDKTWEAAEASRAMGEAYNALLNHIHLAPIITYAYPAANRTAAQTEGDGNSRVLNIRKTIRQGLIDAANAKVRDAGTNDIVQNGRRPTILLAHPSNRFDIEEALQRHQVGGTIYPALNTSITTLIYYEGWEVTVGERTYTYPGCPTDKAYLIDPQRWFRELVKHDLRVDASGADLKRLIENAVVGRARRGIYAAPANAVQEITLPA